MSIGNNRTRAAALAREAIAELDAFSRVILEKSNPRTSAWIKALIVAGMDADKPEGVRS